MADTNTGRQAAVQALFVTNYSYIQNIIYSEPGIHVDEAERLIQSFARRLPLYGGQLTDTSFLRWTGRVLFRLSAFRRIYSDEATRKAVRRKVEFTLSYRYSDLGFGPSDMDEVEAETWSWAISNLRSLLVLTTDAKAVKRPASIKTRLQYVAYWQAMTLKTQRLRQLGKERHA